VPTERPTLEQLIALAKSDPKAIAELVLSFWDRVEALEAKVASMERNSRNSSKPPSSDSGNFSNPPKPRSLRGKSGRKPGGQKGHPGDTLRRVETPDRIVEHRIGADELCPECGEPLGPGSGTLDPTGCECRQVFELPAIRLEVVEHRAERRVCPACLAQVRAAFPEGVNAPAQYGESVQAVALYLGGYQLIPYRRLSEVFAELFNCPLSAGTLANFVKRGGRKAGEAMAPVREALVEAEVAHADETGCRVGGKRHWLHVFSTRALTSYHIDAKRGVEGMNALGLLARFAGCLIHDYYASYFRFACRHFLCGAHLLRELIYIHEEIGQPWAGEMIKLLLEAKELSERHALRISQGRRAVVGEQTRARIQNRYCEIVLEGLALNPEPPPPPNPKPGRVKRSKALNLLIRFDGHYEEIMGYFEYVQVPFDNNLAERDLRMMKTREKICLRPSPLRSGCGTFRSDTHPRAFCDIRSVISTVRKQSRDVLESIRDLIRSPAALGESLARFPKS